MAEHTETVAREVRVWDPLVRLFHWSLVASFAVAYFTGDEESAVHIWSGYIVAGLIAFRVLWGFIGTRHARFSDFLVSPGRVIDYLKSLRSGQPRHYLGHNPAGGWMVIALLVSLAVTTWTGLEVYGAEGHGPLADATSLSMVAPAYADDDEHGSRAGRTEREGDEDGEEFWEELHEVFANLTVLLVLLHVTGVIVSSRLHRENLVKAMITGNK
jgi:cytochrome b